MTSQKPSSAEEEYFAREEAEKKRQLALQRVKEIAEKDRAEQKKLHYMHCPKCGMDLQEISFRDVLVDKCFSCNGLWLDDGELEKLMSESDGSWSKLMGFFARKEFKSE